MKEAPIVSEPELDVTVRTGGDPEDAASPRPKITVVQEGGSIPQEDAGGAYRPGTVMADRYEILQTLGAGGMGQVFKALDRQSQRLCAIKVMHNHLAGKNDLKRFQREASLSFALKHQNIVDVFDLSFTGEQNPFIVMEFVEGKSLDDLLEEKKRLDLEEFIRLFEQIFAGISFAHTNHVVHRDIKPSNIMLQDSETGPKVKIVDFGIAKTCKETGEVCSETASVLASLSGTSAGGAVVDQESLQFLTQPGKIFGSPLYMSPEQFRGQEADCRSEVYALGCMMFEALTGIMPLKGNNSLETVLKRLNEFAPSINEVVTDLTFPEPLAAVIARALAPEPVDRYENVSDLADAVAKFQEQPEQARL